MIALYQPYAKGVIVSECEKNRFAWNHHFNARTHPKETLYFQLRGVGEGINPIWGFQNRESVLNGGWKNGKSLGFDGFWIFYRSYQHSFLDFPKNICWLWKKSISNYKPIYGKFMNSPKIAATTQEFDTEVVITFFVKNWMHFYRPVDKVRK